MRPTSQNSLGSPSNQNVTSSIYSSNSSQQQQKRTSNISLNLNKPHSYLSHTQTLQKSDTSNVNKSQQMNTNQNISYTNNNHNDILDSSMISTAGNNMNQTKFQFDFYINKVEISVPSPIYVFVQVLKGTHSLNTKKKLKVDSQNKVAVFNEKLSIVTCLNRAQINNFTNGNDDYNTLTSTNSYQPKVIQLRLIAFYNSKEKAIGICSVDLSSFVTGPKDSNGRVAHKAITEETELSSNHNESQMIEDDNKSDIDSGLDKIPDSFRSSLIDNHNTFLNTEEELQVQDFDQKSNNDDQSSNNQSNQIQGLKMSSNSSRNMHVLDTTPQSKTQPLKYYEGALKSQRTSVIQKPQKSPIKTQTLNSARFTQNQTPTLTSLQKQKSLNNCEIQQTSTPVLQHQQQQYAWSFTNTIPNNQQMNKTESNSNLLLDSRSSTPNLHKSTLQQQQQLQSSISNNGDVSPFGGNSAESSQNQIRKLEDKIKKLEYENKTLKTENQEQKQKIITLEIKEERLRDYEMKCNEADSYRQRAQSLETALRKLQQDQQSIENERVVIIESYERKLQDMRQQLNEAQNQVNILQTQNQQYQSLNTIESSTQADEDALQSQMRSPFRTQNNNNQKISNFEKQQQQQQLELTEQDEIDQLKQKLTFDGDDMKQNDYKDLYEKLSQQYQFTLKEQQDSNKRCDMLEKQLMKSKEQIVQLANDLYSLEKENIYDN